MNALQNRPWPTCAGRLNITVLWAGMTLCHGWSPTCGSGKEFSPLLQGFFLQFEFTLHRPKTGSFLLSPPLNPKTSEDSYRHIKAERVYIHGLYPRRSSCQHGATLQQEHLRICTPRWTLILHTCVSFSLIWNVLRVSCKHTKGGRVDLHVESWQTSINATHTFVERRLDFFDWLTESRYSVEAFRLQSWSDKHESYNLSEAATAVTYCRNIHMHTLHLVI